MRALSHIARTLVGRLYPRRGHAPAVSAEEDARLLARIAELREPASIPALVGVLYGRSGRAADVAAEAIQRVVDRCGPLDLAQLDGTVRRMSEWHGPPFPVTDIVAVARGLTGTLGVVSFHASGHVREAAVRALAASHDGQALPFLLIRLNDWVSPVRAAAAEAVLSRLVPSNADALVGCLPLLFRLRGQSRGGHGPVVRAALDLLRRPECLPAVRAGLASADRHTRRWAFKLLADEPSTGTAAIVDDASRSADPTLRLWAVQCLRRHLPDEGLLATLDPLLSDRFMPVRREAMYGVVERLPATAPDRLRAALFDAHPSMRDLARFHLRQAGVTDVAALYRARLAGGCPVSVAVAGLGETGSAADADLVAPHLADPDPRVRRAAVRAISRLDPDGHDDELLHALGDRSPRVVKAAREIMVTRRYLLTPDRLWPLFTGTAHPHVRRLVLPLVADLMWWDAAPLLIRAAGWDDADVRGRAVAHLQGWRTNGRRLLAKPTRRQLSDLRETLGLNPDPLPAAVRADAEWHLAHGERASE